MTIKGQALAKFTYADTAEVVPDRQCQGSEGGGGPRGEELHTVKEEAEQWTFYVDSTSNNTGFGAGIMLISPEAHKIHCVLRFGFKALNNEAEYKALIMRLRLAKKTTSPQHTKF